MRPGHQPLQPGRLHFDADGVPASERYGDVYHARAGAIEQARHVFIQGNGLPRRWEGRDSFTVCETGFGLGNNFLALWQAWRRSSRRPGRLHVLSFEAHPFSREDLAAALTGHEGELRDMANALLGVWPPLLPGLHRVEFEEQRLTLTLAFGRIEHLSRQVEANVDAFFLDGFSPSRNPAMWSRELFGQLVRIANKGATAATWCSAGQVRRDLAAAGFLVERTPGFGGKRQMSRAVLRPGLGRALSAPERQDILVVGGGLAGAGVAHSLALRGHEVTVLDPAFRHGPSGSHEGHRCAAMTPALSRDDNPMSRISRAGILSAGRRWAAMPDVMQACGSLLRIEDAQAALWQQSLAHWGFPKEWAAWCSADETRQRCGWPLAQGGIWLGHGAVVRPARLVASLLNQGRIRLRSEAVSTLRRVSDGWQALSEDGQVLARASRAVIAAAAETPALLAAAAPNAPQTKLSGMQRVAGQVAYFSGAGLPPTHAIVAGAGYWLPEVEGVHVGGSTYEFDVNLTCSTEAGARAVAHKVADLLGLELPVLQSAIAHPCGWAGWRMALSDHLPVIAPADKQETLWLSCAYGSRGLSWMTLAGEVLAAKLNGEPQIVERELLRGLRLR